MTVQMPSCPLCNERDRVDELERPERRHGQVLIDLPQGWQFWCDRCTMVFSGTDAEFARMGYDRQTLRDRKAKAAAFDAKAAS